MLQRIPVSNIDESPYQVRKADDDEAIRMLADEIDKNGLWPGAFRGRFSGNGRVQLCYGHRRFKAIRTLGWHEVPIEIEELNDFQMAEMGIAENLQRRGLTDGEKLDGLTRLRDLYMHDKRMDLEAAIAEVGKVSGYSVRWLKEKLFPINQYGKEAQAAIRSGELTIEAAHVAHQIGGEAMIHRAAKDELNVAQLRSMQAALQNVPSGRLRSEVKERMIENSRIKDGEGVLEEARKIASRIANPDNTPPDLMVILRLWTNTINGWSKSLDNVLPFREYIHHHPEGAKKFCEAVGPFVKKLQELCCHDWAGDALSPSPFFMPWLLGQHLARLNREPANDGDHPI